MTCGGEEVYLHQFLKSALHKDEWSASHIAALRPEKYPAFLTGYKAGWSSQPVCNAVKKNPLLLPGLATVTPQSSSHYTVSPIPAFLTLEQKQVWKVRTGFGWLRTGFKGELL
jgi:hypothetical protein